MRSACIDIGSNTTRLLVAELSEDGGLRDVVAQRAFLRLRGELSAQRIEEVVATVATQVRSARAAGAQEIAVVGTAAIRAAVNGADLCAAVRAGTGLAVEVLTGQDEARYAFLGAIGAVAEPPPGCLAVVDVGGGSSEVVCGRADGTVVWSASVPIGSGTLADACLTGDPPMAGEVAAARAAAADAFAALEPPACVAAYAVGGSATSLRRLLGPTLDRPGLEAAIETVCARPAADVARDHDLHPERVRVLPAGMLLLGAASELVGRPLMVACGGLREGLLGERLRARCNAPEKNHQLP